MLIASAGFRLALCFSGKMKADLEPARQLLAWGRETHGEEFGQFSSTFLPPQRRDVATKPKHFDILTDGIEKAPVVGYGFRFEGPGPKDTDKFGLP